MARYRLLFRCVGEALAARGLKCLLGVVPFGDRLFEIARDAHERYRQQCDLSEAVAQVEAVAQASHDEVRAEAKAVFAEVCAPLVPSWPTRRWNERLVGYLEQVPAAVRASLRRPADPSGRSVPKGFSVKQPEDLLKLLPTRLPRFQPGQRPVGNWQLEELLGVGGFGEVWKATHPQFRHLTAALKFCLDETSARYLHHEAGLLDKMMAHSRSPGIVELRNVYLDNDPLCLEYEYINGGDLTGLLHDWLPLSPAKRVEWTSQLIRRLANTLAPLHRLNPPIVHRDLKPANILLVRKDDGQFDVKVGDFGIGGLATRQAVATYRGMSRGDLLSQSLRGSHTPLYASPEQMRGGDFDPRDDVHALGVIWYQLLVGDLGRGFGGDADEDLREAGVNEETIALIRRCVARVDRRISDAGMLAERIAALSAVGTPAASPPAPPPASEDLAAHLERTLAAVAQAHERARMLADRQHDYAAAVQVLNGVAEHLREAALYDMVRDRRDRVERLDREIREAVQQTRVNGLRPRVEELLTLQPGRDDLRRLLERLPKGPIPGETTTVNVGGVPMKFAWIPPGSFLMGSPPTEEQRSDNETQHRVTLTQGYWLGVHEVTQAQWRAVMGNNPSKFKGDNLPVESVSWDDCQAFCRKLGEKTGKRFRLPTEAEWEYACRAGTTTTFHFGETISTEQANYDGNYTYGRGKKGTYCQKTTPVGNYPANSWGLHDMHGNVWEWCQDWFGAYGLQDIKDPKGLLSGAARVLRGGSWYGHPWNCRAAFRRRLVPDRRYGTYGCRVLLVPGPD
ncbi:MAG: bifunctional serine/threonine-protein kinase/formylglycine-generating enzyme family protein [Gemmataceae bacterium]